jgi:hypothetical protein
MHPRSSVLAAQILEPAVVTMKPCRGLENAALEFALCAVKRRSSLEHALLRFFTARIHHEFTVALWVERMKTDVNTALYRDVGEPPLAVAVLAAKSTETIF